MALDFLYGFGLPTSPDMYNLLLKGLVIKYRGVGPAKSVSEETVFC